MKTTTHFILFISFILFSPYILSAEFAVSPMLIEMTGAPNTKQDFEFSVHGKSSGKVKLSLFDLSQQESGHMDFISVSQNSSLSTWIDLKTRRFSVKKGETQVIKGSINTPRGAVGSHLAAIMVEEELSEKEKQGVAVTVRYAIILTLDLGGKKRGRIETQFQNLVLQNVKGEMVLSALFTNDSNREYSLDSQVQLRGENRRLIDRVTLKTQSAWQRGDKASRVFPGSTVRVYGVITKPINTPTINATIRNRFGGKPLPSLRAEISSPESVKKLANKSNPNKKLPVIDTVIMEARGGNQALGRVVLANPTQEKITIEFPSSDNDQGPNFRFSPTIVDILPGQRRTALLRHDWDKGMQNKKLKYQARLLKSGIFSNHISIATQF